MSFKPWQHLNTCEDQTIARLQNIELGTRGGFLVRTNDPCLMRVNLKTNF